MLDKRCAFGGNVCRSKTGSLELCRLPILLQSKKNFPAAPLHNRIGLGLEVRDDLNVNRLVYSVNIQLGGSKLAMAKAYLMCAFLSSH